MFLMVCTVFLCHPRASVFVFVCFIWWAMNDGWNIPKFGCKYPTGETYTCYLVTSRYKGEYSLPKIYCGS